jgi:hypothetical protein
MHDASVLCDILKAAVHDMAFGNSAKHIDNKFDSLCTNSGACFMAIMMAEMDCCNIWMFDQPVIGYPLLLIKDDDI